MNVLIMETALFITQLLLAIATLPCVYRMVVGPRAQDRVLALDALYVCAMLQLVAFGVRTGSALYFETALIIGVLGFVATVALAKFIMRGEVIE
jgi:multicomponent K+:H+ antiporter subunit F